MEAENQRKELLFHQYKANTNISLPSLSHSHSLSLSPHPLSFSPPSPLQLRQADYYVQLLQELLVSRQLLLQQALFAGSLENMWKVGGASKLSSSFKIKKEPPEELMDDQASDVERECARWH